MDIPDKIIEAILIGFFGAFATAMFGAIGLLIKLWSDVRVLKHDMNAAFKAIRAKEACEKSDKSGPII